MESGTVPEDERVAMVEAAVDDGYTVVVMPGYAFGETITQVADEYSDITFIALDVGEGDLGDYKLPTAHRRCGRNGRG